jgi:hypothetical protein
MSFIRKNWLKLYLLLFFLLLLSAPFFSHAQSSQLGDESLIFTSVSNTGDGYNFGISDFQGFDQESNLLRFPYTVQSASRDCQISAYYLYEDSQVIDTGTITSLNVQPNSGYSTNPDDWTELYFSDFVYFDSAKVYRVLLPITCSGSADQYTSYRLIYSTTGTVKNDINTNYGALYEFQNLQDPPPPPVDYYELPFLLQAATTTCVTTASGSQCIHSYSTSSDPLAVAVDNFRKSFDTFFLFFLFFTALAFSACAIIILKKTKYGNY